jgi:hypothetical protein
MTERGTTDGLNADFIRFVCNWCGQMMRVRQSMAGKRGKCPKCRGIVVIQAEETAGADEEPIRLRRGTDGDMAAADAIGGDDFGVKLRAAEAPAVPVRRPEDYVLQTKAEEPEEPPSNLPWYFDMLAYPFSISGAVHFFFFWLVPIIGGVVAPYLALGFGYGQILLLVGTVLFYGYMAYFFFNCVLASAKGERRAPDVSLYEAPSMGDLVGKAFLVLGCYAMCFAPLVLYTIWRIWTVRPPDLFDEQGFVFSPEVPFQVLYWLGVSLLPMSIMSAAAFDSATGLNPLLIIGSIFSTLLPYAGLVILFVAISWLTERLMSAGLGLEVVGSLLNLYLVFLACNLMGRFIRRYEEKLNWEVTL